MMDSRMVCAAALAAVALGARADLPRLDSSAFDYRYEMLALPTAEDLDGDGAADFTGGGTWLALGKGGYAVFDVSSGSKYIGSSAAAGEAGGVWRRYGVTSLTGFTVETRLRITADTGATAAFCLDASASDSKVNALLNFKAGALLWGNAALTNMDTTAAYHTYRVARAAGTATYAVWCDGCLVAEGLGNGLSAGSVLNRLILGGLGGAWKGKAEVAYLRFTKGGYAPPAIGDTDRMLASGGFPHRVDMNDGETALLPTGDGTEWTRHEGAGAAVSRAGGVLSVTLPEKKMVYWRNMSTWTEAVAASPAFTVEVKARITGLWAANDRVLNVWAGSPRATAVLYIGTNCVQWQTVAGYTTLDAHDNTDRMHVFRLAYDGVTHHGFTVWRDDQEIGTALADYVEYAGANFSFLRAGVASTSTHGGSFDIDYIRWTTGGAFLPDTRRGFVLVVR